MKSLEILPSPALRHYVKLFWLLAADAADHRQSSERIAPDGILELVLHYRVPMAVRFAGEQFELQPVSSLVSQTRRFIDISPSGATGLISARFHPWGGYHFLGLPVAEIADRCTPAAELWGRDIARLEENLASAGDSRSRIGLVEAFLLSRLIRHQKHDVEGLLRGLWQSATTLRIGEFCRQAGVCERTLERRCMNALGMTPRSYRKLARFLSACSLLKRVNVDSLTDAAYLCGYYDQAHFTRDFKEYSGMTPGQYLSSGALSHLELG